MRIIVRLYAALMLIALPLGSTSATANAAAIPAPRFGKVAADDATNTSVNTAGLPAVRQVQLALTTWAIICLTTFFQRVEAK